MIQKLQKPKKQTMPKQKPISTNRHKQCEIICTHNAFALLEVVFVVLILGVAFGILGRFYYARTQSQELVKNIEQTQQEQILTELESKISSKSHKIIGTNGEFCEGAMFESAKQGFKIFKPQNCEQ